MVALAERELRAPQIPIGVRLKARNLYLLQGIPPKQVAEIVGLSQSQFKNLAHREGWTKVRKATQQRAIEKSDAQAHAKLDEVSEAIAAECDEHSLTALKRTGEALARTDEFAARDAQSFSGALKNLVTIARTVRGQDRNQSDAPGSVNMIFLGTMTARPDRAALEPVNVTPTLAAPYSTG